MMIEWSKFESVFAVGSKQLPRCEQHSAIDSALHRGRDAQHSAVGYCLSYDDAKWGLIRTKLSQHWGSRSVRSDRSIF
jgi:hypothetical protein